MSDSPSAQVPSAVPNLAPWGFALGVAGLFPFLALGGIALLEPAYRVAVHMPLVAYGAVILAFVGALHWGIGMTLPAAGAGQRKLALAWSGAPALVAWLAIMLPVGLDLAVLIATFWVHFAFDYHLARQLPLPPWYLPLRVALTVGATAALALALSVGTGREAAPHHPFMTGDESATCPAQDDRPPGLAI